LAQSKFQTTQALHIYDHKQLSLFFAEMIKGNIEARTNAETLLREKELVMEEQIQTIQELSEKNKSLNVSLSQAQEENFNLTETLQEKNDALEKADALIAEQNSNLLSLTKDKSEALALVDSLKLAHEKLKTELDLKVAENQGLMKEQTFTKSQLENLTKELEKSQSGMDDLTKEHEEVVVQKEDLNTTLVNTKTLHQKSLHDLALKDIEIKGFIKENASLQGQVVALTKKLQEEQSFNQRLGKLEEILLKENKV
jgi:chromosome segregation ATPase